MRKEFDFKKVALFFSIPFLLVLFGTYERAGAAVFENAIFAGIFWSIILSAIFGRKKASEKDDQERVTTSVSVKSTSDNENNIQNAQVSFASEKMKSKTKGKIVVKNGLWECKVCHIKMLIAGDYCSKCREHKKKIAVRHGEDGISKINVQNKKTGPKGKIIVKNGLWECKVCHIKMLIAGDYCSKCREHKKKIAVRY